MTLALLTLMSVGCSDSHGSEAPSRGAEPSSTAHHDGGSAASATRLDGAASDAGSARRPGDSDSGAGHASDARAASAASTDASASSGVPGATDADASAVSTLADASTRPASKKFVGNTTTRGQVRTDFATLWDQITPENEGKWGSVESSRNQMNWAGLDRVHDYAKQHGLVFKQHNFVWGSQQPSWLTGLSASEQRAEVEEWIRLFCERYPDVALIDVVNEPPPHTTPVYLDALGGAGSSGYDWIVQAFKWSGQYCPNAVLILNDYNNIEYSGEATHFIDIAKKVKAAGAPIDALGAQSHDAYKLPTATVMAFVDKLASETGLPVYITEYDINEADEQKQADIMTSQMTMFWQHGAVKGVTLWGYVSGATWQANTGLMTEAGQQRAAMKWLLKFLGR